MVKKIKQIIIALVLGLILLFALVGCGAKTPAKETTNTNNSNTPSSFTNQSNSGNEGTPTGDLNGTQKFIVVYFSRTNNTERIAGFVKESTDSDSYEILAKVPYTDADINYNDSNSRANREQNDSAARPEIGSDPIDLSSYDVIYLGYPIWWGQAPKILYTFVESYDLSGKTIVPFCTSASSSIGSSATNLAGSATDATWLTGKRFSSSSSKSEVSAWLSALNINK